MVAVARTFAAAESGDRREAVELARSLPTPTHAAPHAHWVVGLVGTLAPDRDAELAEAVRSHPSLRPALEAGRAARSTLAGGPPVGAEHLPYLPASWCDAAEPEIRIELIGTPGITTDGRPIDHPFWERARVRELCCYLALVDRGSRTLAAQRLWPDLSSDAAAKNLRVTLANLLDVLDPDRQKGSGSALLEERHGTIGLVDDHRVTIDVREERRDARTVVDGARVGDLASAMAAARRLVRRPGGLLLGGAGLGGWAEEPEQGRRDLLLRAIAAAAPRALSVGDPELAEALARRGLAEDPWAERLHQVLVRARLHLDDLDGARRAMRSCAAALAELGAVPEEATRRLARDLGLPAVAPLATAALPHR